MSIKGQRLAQIGEGGAWGVDAAPTIELSGMDPDSFNVPPSIVTETIRAARGGIVPGRDIIVPRHEVSGVSIGGWVIYEQIPYFLNMLSAAAEAASRVYAAPTSAQVTPDLQTLVMGVDNLVYNIASPCIASITFDFAWGEPLKWSADLMGHSIEADAFAALDEVAAASLSYALCSQGAVYIDALAGTLGATAFGCPLSGSITVNCNRKYKRCVGSLYPSGVYDSPYWDVTGTLVLEETATSAGFVDAIVAGATTRLIRIDFDNGAAAGANRGLMFDLAAQLHVSNIFTDSDDLSTVELTFEPIEEGDWTTPAAGEIDGYFEITSDSGVADLYV
jgi:hypothetical protein